MIFTRRYNLVNNLMGWAAFLVALITYWLTLEPTASYWDCGEFIIQADKLEVGHPPGNPIFMLTARFFANFAFGDASKVALMVNAMSGLLSALTILLLFWSVTHLVRRLICTDDSAELSLPQYLVVMGSGLCGALAYTWSDTFWFSAVEGEVYAFSSFCTALVFWLILKWANRCDDPRSDRWLILIAYIIGVSIAVHLLNLLCIPAIVLVYAYRKVEGMNVKKSLLALAIGFAIIVLVLYGLVPGFTNVAAIFELLAVNTMHLPFNTGLIFYAIATIGILVWALWELYTQRSPMRIRLSVIATSLISGILFIGSGLWIGIILTLALVVVLFYVYKKSLPLRWLNIAVWSIAVIFVGYSSYALILIRSNSGVPMNQNAPDNIFSLHSYLQRDQYGSAPLLYGYTFESGPMMETSLYDNPDYPGVTEQSKTPVFEKGARKYSKGVDGVSPENQYSFLTQKQVESVEELSERGGDFYAMYDYEVEPVMNPELNMLLPRIHSSLPSHQAAYKAWVPSLVTDADMVEISSVDASTGEKTELLEADYARDAKTGEYLTNNDGLPYHNLVMRQKPTMSQNLEFFFNYQLNHMYWRYFLWNFAGRQNDINNQWGEKDAGNWISGIPAIDNSRLGDQSLLPDEYGKDNPGHNVFYMLPLLLGIMGLLWQAFRGQKGIEQFWIVFFLFFMTGIAIVLYLNQPPLQPRERDYAYAGSFYAFAIWIGMGVAAIYRLIIWGASYKERKEADMQKSTQKRVPLPGTPKPEPTTHAEATPQNSRLQLIAAIVAALIGVAVPLQMVSQTWDDHDRSGRYAARDYAINYLNSLEPNAIVFCNGDNDTFPLWYVQEVEGVRPDVKIINLSYLNSEWYANQMRTRTYDAAPVAFTAKPSDYAYERLAVVRATEDDTDFSTPTPLIDALKEIYSDKSYSDAVGSHVVKHANTYIPIDEQAVRKRGLVPEDREVESMIPIDLNSMYLNTILMYDIIATNAANGWERPIYWACTVGDENYEALKPWLRSTGMALQLVPYRAEMETQTDITYDIVNKYLWGGADNYENPPYFDETAGRMLSTTRLTVLDLAKELTLQGSLLMNGESLTDAAKKRFDMALKVLSLYDKHLSGAARPQSFTDLYQLGSTYCTIGEALRNKDISDKGLKVLAEAMQRYAQNVKYAQMLAEKWGFTKSAAGRIIGLEAQASPENSAILFSYYQLVIAYNSYQAVEAADYNRAACADDVLLGNTLTSATLSVLKKAGISDKLAQTLKKYYIDANGDDADYASASGQDMDELIKSVVQSAEIVVEMQGKTPEEYAQASDYERQVDSLFGAIVEQFGYLGGTVEMLQEYDIFNKVDLERSQALLDEFTRAHPELLEE